MSFAIYVFLVYFMFEHIIIYLFIKKKLKSPKINTFDIKISKKISSANTHGYLSQVNHATWYLFINFPKSQRL
jgi:hypothetical protein